MWQSDVRFNGTPSKSKERHPAPLLCQLRSNRKFLVGLPLLYVNSTSGQPQSAESSTGWSVLSTLAKLGLSSASGVVMGIALEKSRVVEPRLIQGQFALEQFCMSKVWMSAIATGLVSFSAMMLIPDLHPQTRQLLQDHLNGLKNNNKGPLACAVGGSIHGIGMALCGTTPSIAYCQLGAGVENAAYTLLGGYIGALAYGLLEPFVVSLTAPKGLMLPERYTLQAMFSTPYFFLAPPIALVLIGDIWLLEKFFPWRDEVVETVADNWLSQQACSPWLAGIAIGLLNIPIVQILSKHVGASTSYCSIVSQAFCCGPLQKVSPYLAKTRSGMKNWWQIFFCGGIALGGFLSARASGTFGDIPGPTKVHAIIGGALMIFGARTAHGCASGHAISTISLLSTLPMVNTLFMVLAGTAAWTFHKRTH